MTSCSVVCEKYVSLCTAVFEFEIKAKFIAGVDTRFADCLSRWSDGSGENKDKFLTEFGHQGTECQVSKDMFQLSDV